MRRVLTVVFALAALSCASEANATHKGVVGGAVAGGIGGAVVAGPPGAVVGAVGGALIGNHVTNHRHWSHRRYRHHH
jgi:uncharacterized protein YcfJ